MTKKVDHAAAARKMSAKKAQESRKRNDEAVARLNARLMPLKIEIAELERQRDSLLAATMQLVDLPDAFNGRRLASLTEIITFSRSWHDSSGVYFLIDDGEVVYVGQSVGVWGRISIHHTEGKKKFDSVSWVECPREALDRIESLYIHMLRPKYNGKGPLGPMRAPVPLNDLLVGIKETYE